LVSNSDSNGNNISMSEHGCCCVDSDWLQSWTDRSVGYDRE